MPIESELLKNAPVPIDACPLCGAKPFDPFMRGQVKRFRRSLWKPWKDRPYCALICWSCKRTVGYEEPPQS